MTKHTLSAGSHHFATGVMSKLLVAASFEAKKRNQIVGHNNEPYITIEQLADIAINLFEIAHGTDNMPQS